MNTPIRLSASSLDGRVRSRVTGLPLSSWMTTPGTVGGEDDRADRLRVPAASKHAGSELCITGGPNWDLLATVTSS
jgi:hypothetical protein